MALLLLSFTSDRQAAAKQYTQPFQNETTSLAGKAVSANMYFVKMGYWQVKKATLNLNFQVSQLTDRQVSDVTITVNGITFNSFRPSKAKGLQTKQIKIPAQLLKSQNNLQVTGQLLNQNTPATPTPANWLTIVNTSNVNFDYEIERPTNHINDFYGHMTGADTIAANQSAVETPLRATDTELTASLRALTGLTRFVTAEDRELPLRPLGKDKRTGFRLLVANFDHLPPDIRRQLPQQRLVDHAVIQVMKRNQRPVLVVTSKSDQLLEKAAQFVANEELMRETAQTTKWISPQTATFTSVLQFQGRQPLLEKDDHVQGAGHHVKTFFVQLPNDHLNAAGSTINLRLRYAKNLDFKRSLVTIKVNNQAIGSQRLSSERADNDTVRVKLPANLPLNSTFTVQADFDLALPEETKQAVPDQNAWASVLADSYATIRSTPNRDLLFDNYPSVFMKDQAVQHLALVRPDRLTENDFATMANLFGLIGNYAKQNTGEFKVYHGQPSAAELAQANVLAFGTPAQTPLIRQLNDQLYFQYNSAFTGFKSNEKLSLEEQYAQRVGTAQLLWSPFNSHHGLLVVTGAHDDAVYRASTQLNRQVKIAQYRQADTIVVDDNNQHFSYRFKKQKLLKDDAFNVTFHKQGHFWVYMGLSLLAIAFFGFVVISILWRHGLLKRKGNWHEHR
ncbi:cellulose biosynthesis cyclic di-GMP-binding regulatory protein BcsB [Secundilactobacillus hailunensis]|uniref:Cellulose biosynthesis cyclic di-GMP-binding regulatory protein BcsB n=1 Tax=Secundilactobacillus hailunensis TaxID=2559923 RepID=A0ABW1T8F8_9LACO|nr:cellulose biosynthesis cyclic di-GMP-binding regulatory protein BcsB [Secundilactobacillus hailunensis]